MNNLNIRSCGRYEQGEFNWYDQSSLVLKPNQLIFTKKNEKTK